jgi:hypothetical protein
MILSSKQRRLLKVLADVDNLGGRVGLFLKHGDKGDYYEVSGWKSNQSEPMDVAFTIGADDVDQLERNRCIHRSDNADGDTSITPAGLDLVESEP